MQDFLGLEIQTPSQPSKISQSPERDRTINKSLEFQVGCVRSLQSESLPLDIIIVRKQMCEKELTIIT